MKKLFLLIFGLMLVTSSALALSPEELKGKWVSNKITESDPSGSGSVDITVTFNFDGVNKASITQGTNLNLSLGEGIKLFMYNEVLADGEYTVAGDSVTIKFSAESVKLNITEDDIRVIGVDDVAAVNEMKSQMVASAPQQLAAVAEQISSTPEVLNNVMILPKKMTAMMNGKMVTFKKK